jgi:hypothetical protein
MDQFGRSLAALGDLDGDGLTELAVGADRDDSHGPDKGAVWVLHMTPGGFTAGAFKITEGEAGFGGPLADSDHFGNALAALGDQDGDGRPDFAVGAEGTSDGGPSKGAAWVLFFEDPTPPPTEYCFGTGCPCGNDAAGTGCVNSSGAGAKMSASGSTSVAADDLVLTVSGVPSGKNGIVYMGGGPNAAPFGNGLRCVKSGGLGVKRFPLQSAGPGGTMSQGPGMVALKPTALVAGSTWYFQAWFRDVGGPCGKSFNTSSAVAVSWVP